MSVWSRGVGVLAIAVGAGLAYSEWVTWRASREAIPAGNLDADRVEDAETVLVLGCPFAALHRWRVRIAMRSTDPARARFIFSGAAVRSALSEAQMMADYAVSLGVPVGSIILEDRATTTVENITNSTPLMADAPVIKIASNTFHALRARRILGEQSPDLATRLVRTRDYLPLEWGPLHAVMAAHELYRQLRVALWRRRFTKPWRS